MLALTPHRDRGTPLSILCVGAHSDDIEIGALGTILTLAERHPDASVTWAVFCATGDRLSEARASAEQCTEGFSGLEFVSYDFEDGYFPAQYADIKRAFRELRSRCEPDIVFSHYAGDAHQDHRVIAELTWQTFRDNFVLEYEIPKYEGDLGNPAVYMPLTGEIAAQKTKILMQFFGSQRNKSWFAPETFESLMRLRGVQSKVATGFAEAFFARKIVLD